MRGSEFFAAALYGADKKGPDMQGRGQVVASKTTPEPLMSALGQKRT